MPTDEELIEEIKNGSLAAMEVLVKKHYKDIFAYVYRKLGDYHRAYDLTQEAFKGRDQGVLEMEMTCKFSAHEIMLARLLLIGVYNLTLNTILTISFASMIDTISMGQILLIWFTPLTFFAALSLWLSMKFRGPVFVTTIVSLWMVFSILFVSRPSWIDAILNFNIALLGYDHSPYAMDV